MHGPQRAVNSLGAATPARPSSASGKKTGPLTAEAARGPGRDSRGTRARCKVRSLSLQVSDGVRVGVREPGEGRQTRLRAFSNVHAFQAGNPSACDRRRAISTAVALTRDITPERETRPRERQLTGARSVGAGAGRRRQQACGNRISCDVDESQRDRPHPGAPLRRGRGRLRHSRPSS